mgnify:CR=1 FL=1
MITIRQPIITQTNGRARLSAVIEEDGLIKTLWYEVDERFADGLNTRADAFVVGLLYWAMIYHQDITCEAPLTERLHFQLQEILCPVLTMHSTRFRTPHIMAPLIAEPLQTQGAVGTGCSGGIDSFHVIANFLQAPWTTLRLTHLCTFAVGHVYEHTDNLETQQLLQAGEERAASIASALGLDYVPVRSNYNEEFPQTLIYMAPYADMACVHALGKLFGTYFYASAGEGSHHLDNRECKDFADYDIFSLPNFSTPSLTLYSEGAGVMRWDKIRRVAEFPLAQKMLNVCCQELRNCGPSDGHTNRNCGVCDKCQRTLLDLDALGLLESFGAEVFDLDAHRKTGRRLALRFMLKRHLDGDPYMRFCWNKLHHELTLADWWAERKPFLRRYRNKLRDLFMPNRIPRFKDPRKGTGK